MERIDMMKARIRLSIKKAKAARQKKIPPETNVSPLAKTGRTAYENYFIDQVEPGR